MVMIAPLATPALMAHARQAVQGIVTITRIALMTPVFRDWAVPTPITPLNVMMAIPALMGITVRVASAYQARLLLIVMMVIRVPMIPAIQ